MKILLKICSFHICYVKKTGVSPANLTEYVMKIKKGKIIQEGLGLSFFYNTMTTSMMVMPATAFDTSFVYDDIMTADFQKINVQGDISYTIADYRKAAKMVDFPTKIRNETRSIPSLRPGRRWQSG